MLIGYYCMYLLYYWHYVNIIDDTTRNNPLLRYRAGQRIFSVSPRATAPRENALISKLLKCQVSFLNIHVLIPKEYLITNLKVKGPYHYGPYLVCIRKKKVSKCMIWSFISCMVPVSATLVWSALAASALCDPEYGPAPTQCASCRAENWKV